MKSRIIEVQKLVKTIEFFFGLNIADHFLSYTDNLLKTLQVEKMSANGKERTAELVASVLQDMREKG